LGGDGETRPRRALREGIRSFEDRAVREFEKRRCAYFVALQRQAGGGVMSISRSERRGCGKRRVCGWRE